MSTDQDNTNQQTQDTQAHSLFATNLNPNPKPSNLFSGVTSKGSLFSGLSGVNSGSPPKSSLFGNPQPGLFSGDNKSAPNSIFSGVGGVNSGSPTKSSLFGLFPNNTSGNLSNFASLFASFSKPSGNLIGGQSNETLQTTSRNALKPNFYPGNEIIAELKVVLVGEGGVGKSAFVKKHLNLGLERKYIATLGVEVISLIFFTKYGAFKFNIWDCAGQEKLGGLREGYYIDAHCAIIMFDVTSRITYKNVPKWHKDLARICGDVPIALVGNKVDVKKEMRKVQKKDITYPKNRKMVQYYEVSTKTGYQLEKPFLYILRGFTGDKDLEFLDAPVQDPIEFDLSDDEAKKLNSDSQMAEESPLPFVDLDEEFNVQIDKKED